ncbi:MAG: hypothetical protein ACRDHN_02500, partial [Thermomicrobiales bacterium]
MENADPLEYHSNYEVAMPCDSLRGMWNYDQYALPGQDLPEGKSIRRRIAERISQESRREFDDQREFRTVFDANESETRIIRIVNSIAAAVDAVVLEDRSLGISISAKSRQWLTLWIAAECFDIPVREVFPTALVSNMSPALWVRNRMITEHGTRMGRPIEIKDWFADPIVCEDQSTDGAAGYQ